MRPVGPKVDDRLPGLVDGGAGTGFTAVDPDGDEAATVAKAEDTGVEALIGFGVPADAVNVPSVASLTSSFFDGSAALVAVLVAGSPAGSIPALASIVVLASLVCVRSVPVAVGVTEVIPEANQAEDRSAGRSQDKV